MGFRLRNGVLGSHFQVRLARVCSSVHEVYASFRFVSLQGFGNAFMILDVDRRFYSTYKFSTAGLYSASYR